MRILYSALLLPAFAFAEAPIAIQDALVAWDPISVEANERTLTITANEHRVTERIYSAIINNGVCMPIWLGNLDVLDGINEVVVINKYQKQVYVFEGGKSSCNKLGEATQKDNKLVLMAHSRMY